MGYSESTCAIEGTKALTGVHCSCTLADRAEAILQTETSGFSQATGGTMERARITALAKPLQVRLLDQRRAPPRPPS